MSDIAERESAAPVTTDWSAGSFDAEADIGVVGGGGGGLAAALFARWQGDEVILLEKAPELGGTARKAAFWYWVPNNAQMRAAGTEDREEDFLRYVARLSRPNLYELCPERQAAIAQVPTSLDRVIEALEHDHDFLLAGDVFTADLIEAYVEHKREEVDEVRLRPHPWEFALYLDA